jgi:hypothetical protein
MTASTALAADESQPLLTDNNGTTTAYVGLPVDSRAMVAWDSEADLDNPRNWSTQEKCSIVAILTAVTVLSYPTISLLLMVVPYLV